MWTLTTFTEDAGENVAKAVQTLKAKNQLKGLVFDLRGNGGGLLTEAVNVVNVFVQKDVDVVSMRSKVKEWDKGFKTLNAAIDLDVPVAVLVNPRFGFCVRNCVGCVARFGQSGPSLAKNRMAKVWCKTRKKRATARG